MFGGLHNELAALKTLGDLLDSSGWTSWLVQAGVASSGRADSFLKASHITRTRRAHQLTASALYSALQQAYKEYASTVERLNDILSQEKWINQQQECQSMF